MDREDRGLFENKQKLGVRSGKDLDLEFRVWGFSSGLILPERLTSGSWGPPVSRGSKVVKRGFICTRQGSNLCLNDTVKGHCCCGVCVMLYREVFEGF
jgi:hypothetical protein